MDSLFETPQEAYSPNATDPTTVVAFDTDLTIDYAQGPIPLEHVIELRERDDVLVWSTGYNQTLRDRAEIPGMEELKDARGVGDGFVERAERMRLLREEYPNAEEYIIADDVDLRMLEPEWDYYQPAEYVVEVLNIPPEDWRRVIGTSVEDYTARIGRFADHFPPEEMDLTASNPYSARVDGGVRASVRNRDDRPDEPRWA